MNIIVCCKQVLDPEAPPASFKIDPAAGKGCAPRNKSEFIRALQSKSYLGGS